MKMFASCLLAASAVCATAQTPIPDVDAYIKHDPASANLRPEWVANAWHTFALASALTGTDGTKASIVSAVESRATLASQAKTVGEAVVSVSLSKYADDVFSTTVLAKNLFVGFEVQPLLKDVTACQTALTAVLEAGKSPSHIPECEPVGPVSHHPDNGKIRRTDDEAFLAKYPFEAELSSNWISQAARVLTLTTAVTARDGALIGDDQADEAAFQLGISQQAKSIGEVILAEAVQNYERDAVNRLKVATIADAKDFYKAHITNVQACREKILGQIRQAKATMRIRECALEPK